MAQSRLPDVQRVRGRTLAILHDLSQQELDCRPAAGKWSAGEVADHLIKSNQMHIREINKLVALKRAGQKPYISVGLSQMGVAIPLVPDALLPLAELPVGIFNYFVPNSVREFMLSHSFVPAQAPPILQPEARRDRAVLLSELSAELRRTEMLFSENDDLDFKEMRYYHPLFGLNTVDDILGLMTSHEERHQKQLKEILRAVR
jgi:hypothetical protein